MKPEPLGRLVLGISLHYSLLADHPSHRFPLCGYATSQSGIDHDSSVALLRLRMRHTILGLRLLDVSITNDEPNPGRYVPRWPPQRPRVAVSGKHRHSRYSLYISLNSFEENLELLANHEYG